MSDPGIELGDGVCDFEKVPPDRKVRVRVRVRGTHSASTHNEFTRITSFLECR